MPDERSECKDPHQGADTVNELNRYQRGYYGNMNFITPLIIAGLAFGLLLPVAWRYILKPALVWILSLLTGV